VSVPQRGTFATVVLAYAAFVHIGISAGIGGVLLPEQMADYHVDKATIGVTFFVFSAGFLLAGVVTGALIHRLGFRAALGVSGGALLLAAGYTAVRPPFAGLVAVQLLAGFAMGALESVLNAYLADLPGATTLLNRLHAFFGVGALLGPLLATWVLRAYPWPVVWLVVALAGVPLLVGFLLCFPRRAPARPEVTRGDGPSGSLLAAVRSPAVVLGGAFLAVYVGLEISVGNWGFTFLTTERGQHEVAAGYTVSGYWLGLTLGRFLISPVATRLGVTAVGMTTGCLAAVAGCAVLVWLAPFGTVAVIGLALMGFFLGPVFPTTMAVAPSLTQARLVPTAIGVMNGVSVIGSSVFPWMAGAIAQGAGSWTLLPFVAALAGVQLLMWWRMAGYMAAGGPRPGSPDHRDHLPLAHP
jgi:fucose permease